MPAKKKARIDVSQKTLGYDGYQLQLQTASGKQPYIILYVNIQFKKVQWVFWAFKKGTFHVKKGSVPFKKSLTRTLSPEVISDSRKLKFSWRSMHPPPNTHLFYTQIGALAPFGSPVLLHLGKCSKCSTENLWNFGYPFETTPKVSLEVHHQLLFPIQLEHIL